MACLPPHPAAGGLAATLPRDTCAPRPTFAARRREQSLGEDEAILFGGMCLARLTGLPALLHRVEAGGKVRLRYRVRRPRLRTPRRGAPQPRSSTTCD